MRYELRCTRCGTLSKAPSSFRCSECGSVLEVFYDYSTLKIGRNFRRSRITRSKYLPFLPVKKLSASLGEGATPLKKQRMPTFKGINLYLKMETENPTNTFKDRGSAVEISKAMELGFKKVCCASTGNMGLSVAHYAKRKGMKATIFISSDANGIKIRKIRDEGARLVEINGDFNKAMDSAEKYARKNGNLVCGDYHYRKEGQKTLGFEIIEQLRYKVPDFIFVPVGNGTLFSGIYKGIEEFKAAGLIGKAPKLIAVQSENCNPLTAAYNRKRAITYVKPDTDADAIAVGYPTFGFECIVALEETGGAAIEVSEDEIEDALRFLERNKVYAELAGAAGFAGFIKMFYSRRRELLGKTAVVVITGNNEGIFK